MTITSATLLLAALLPHATIGFILPQHPPPCTTTALFAGGKARFSSPLVSSSSSPTSALDTSLSLLLSDVGSIALGFIGMSYCVLNRLQNMEMPADVLAHETRSDLLAIVASGAVLLNGLSELDVTSALAETVILEGEVVREAISEEGNVLKWGLESALKATPAKTAVLLRRGRGDSQEWKPTGFAGVVPSRTVMEEPLDRISPILERFVVSDGDPPKKETYLPTLQALPGRVEFSYLPNNAQEALMVPVGRDGVLVLGSDTAKSFSPKDVAWCQVLAQRMGKDDDA